MKNKTIKALDDLIFKLENDPKFLEQAQADICRETIAQENKYDSGLPFMYLGDSLAYIADETYLDVLLEELYTGQYSRHGNGD